MPSGFLAAESLNIHLQSIASLASKGSAITLAGKPEDTNSITDPKKIVPVTTTVRGVKPGFTCKMPPHSVVVLKVRP